MANDDLSEPERKKVRLSDPANNGEESGASECSFEHPVHDESFEDFGSFEMEKILNNNEEAKTVSILGKWSGKDDLSIVTLEKLPFNSEHMHSILSRSTKLKLIFHNDVYYNQIASLPPELNEVKSSIIYPAEEKHIQRFEKKYSSFIDETPDLFSSITQPYIAAHSFSKQWIYNILEHKKEKDRIIYEDPDEEIGFVLLPDLKWTGEQMESLYLQALIRRRDLTCIRDLTADHIPMLKNIYDKCIKAIDEKFHIPVHKLRAYCHYQPSFYHLHFHFSALSYDAPGTWAGKAHLLKSVISNLEIASDYYQKATLSYTIPDNHPLKSWFDKYGYFTRVD